MPTTYQSLYPLLLLSLSLFHHGIGMECWNGCSYQCWEAVSFNVTSPSHFIIDTATEKIVLTAKNSVCHISLDLSTVDNVKNVTPDQATLSYCTGDPLYNSKDICHNFHHILLLPSSPGMMVAGSNTSLSDTILECGSNAFQPQCNYRMRANLTSVAIVDGADFVPSNAGHGGTTSLWLSTGQLVSASPLNTVDGFGLVISGVPYNGPAAVGTVLGWFDRSAQFVSMYEIDEYIYTFFTEDPDETDQNTHVIYSRVSRVCKDDDGVTDTINPLMLEHNIFTTFLKARMTCVSSGNGDIPYYYDELQDTFLVESEGSDGSIERNLYAVFNSPKNGPEGSAVCVYSFGDSEASDEGVNLDTVFDGDYLQETGLNQFEAVDNPTPLTCSSERTAQEANQLHLMSDTVSQADSALLHLQVTGYTLKKILVTTVRDVGGVSRDVMYIAGTREGTLVLLKTTFDPVSQTQHVIWEQELKLSEVPQASEEVQITRMQFLGNGSSSDDSLYVGTTNALYRIPVANCHSYRDDCCACVSARDPHCGYDTSDNMCVGVDNGASSSSSDSLIQNVVDGDIGVCEMPPSVASLSAPSPTPAVMATSVESSVVVTATPTTPSPPETPTQDGINGEDDVMQSNLGTIMGSVFGFVGGMVLGIIGTAFCYLRRGRFVWSKYIPSARPSVQLQQHQTRRRASDKGATNKGGDQDPASGATNNKSEEFERNNNSDMNPHSNATNVIHVQHIAITNFSHPRGKGKRGSNENLVFSPPPYSEKKPTSLPSNGTVMSSEFPESNPEKLTTPTKECVKSTPEHKLNKAPPTNLAPSSPQKPTPPSPLALSLSQTMTSSSSLSNHSSLTLTPAHLQSHAHRHPYRRADSYNHAVTAQSNGYHSSTLPPQRKRHSSTSHPPTTPTSRRPISAEAPPTMTSFTRPENLASSAAAASYRARSVTMATTPTGKQRALQPRSPFNATPTTPTREGVPGSPYSVTSSTETPLSSCSGGSTQGAQHFKFPQSKFHHEGAGGSPSYHKSLLVRNPNMKATGLAVEPTTNQEQALYGLNMAARVHTIDRKSKVPNGHHHHHHHSSQRERLPSVTIPLPDTTVIEIDGSQVGCTDC